MASPTGGDGRARGIRIWPHRVRGSKHLIWMKKLPERLPIIAHGALSFNCRTQVFASTLSHNETPSAGWASSDGKAGSPAGDGREVAGAKLVRDMHHVGGSGRSPADVRDCSVGTFRKRGLRPSTFPEFIHFQPAGMFSSSLRLCRAR